MHGHADLALEILEQLDPGDNKELEKTLADIRAMAYLGKYYAHKIMGATELELYRILDTGNSQHQQNAVDELTEASNYWKLYAESARSYYKNPLWTNRVGYVDWDQIYSWCLDDIAIARNGN